MQLERREHKSAEEQSTELLFLDQNVKEIRKKIIEKLCQIEKKQLNPLFLNKAILILNNDIVALWSDFGSRIGDFISRLSPARQRLTIEENFQIALASIALPFQSAPQAVFQEWPFLSPNIPHSFHMYQCHIGKGHQYKLSKRAFQACPASSIPMGEGWPGPCLALAKRVSS